MACHVSGTVSHFFSVAVDAPRSPASASSYIPRLTLPANISLDFWNSVSRLRLIISLMPPAM